MNEKCVQIIPSLSNVLSPYKADLGALETIITTDVENHKKPLIVFARAGNNRFYVFLTIILMLIIFISGAHVTGQMDDIVNLKELCSKHNIWLHLSGDNLSGLALTTFKTKVF